MKYIVVCDGFYGREYIECSTLEEAEQTAEGFELDHSELYNYLASTQIYEIIKKA